MRYLVSLKYKMIYYLENDSLKLKFRSLGGELQSIFSKKDNTEHLWNGDETYWKYHAPVLFPIVGKVLNGEYKVNGSLYKLPQHGLARVSTFSLLKKTEKTISFELKSSEETLKVYPYEFSLIIRYTLENNSVITEYIVKNTNNKTMYFSLGAHPAFVCPFSEGEPLDDYYFEFNKKETASIMPLTKDGYAKKGALPFFNDENIINLSRDLFKNDALIFNNLNSNKITLKSKSNNKALEFDFTGFPYLAVWSKPTGAPFVCIEPWFGHADFEDFDDDFSKKHGILSLESKKIFNCAYSISIV